MGKLKRNHAISEPEVGHVSRRKRSATEEKRNKNKRMKRKKQRNTHIANGVTNNERGKPLKPIRTYKKGGVRFQNDIDSLRIKNDKKDQYIERCHGLMNILKTERNEFWDACAQNDPPLADPRPKDWTESNDPRVFVYQPQEG